jgi:glycosyltransferase involved in cell wall biosynthesis
MINILVCENGEGYGGTAAYLFSFLKQLDRSVFCPLVVFSREAKGPFIPKISDLGFEVEFLAGESKRSDSNLISTILGNLSVPMLAISVRKLRTLYRLCVLFLSSLAATYRLIRLIRKRGIEFVFVNQEVFTNPPAVMAAAICGVPSLARQAGIGLYRGRILLRLLSYFPSVLIASSNAESRYHLELKLPYKQMVTIFEGVDITEFEPSSRDGELLGQLGIPAESRVIASISRFDPGKGHEDFLRAAGLVLKELPDTFFLVVGDGDESIKMELQRLVQSLNIEKRIVFAGWRTDVARILHSVDVFVHCPNFSLEGMGIATLEAIACGKPVVITKNWGLADTTEDGYNGFIVPIGDCRALADKILLLLADDDLRRKMGENARTRAIELFDIRRNVKSIQNVIFKVLNRKEDFRS